MYMIFFKTASKRILAVGSIHEICRSSSYEEGITELDELIDRGMEIQAVRAFKQFLNEKRRLDNDDPSMLSAWQH